MQLLSYMSEACLDVIMDMVLDSNLRRYGLANNPILKIGSASVLNLGLLHISSDLSISILLLAM